MDCKSVGEWEVGCRMHQFYGGGQLLGETSVTWQQRLLIITFNNLGNKVLETEPNYNWQHLKIVCHYLFRTITMILKQ